MMASGDKKNRACQNIIPCFGSPAVFEILFVVKTRGFPSLLYSSFGFYICSILINRQSEIVNKIFEGKQNAD